MQRLKQHNLGAVLPLGEAELLSGHAMQNLPGGAWGVVRMRLAADGTTERALHLTDGANHTFFHHEWLVVVGPARAFERAWRYGAACFPITGGTRSIPGLEW